jgi:hypothetical protein
MLIVYGNYNLAFSALYSAVKSIDRYNLSNKSETIVFLGSIAFAFLSMKWPL